MKLLTSNGLVRLWSRILDKLKASCITYDNTTSAIDAVTVQEAIDETNEKINDVVVTRMGNCYLKYEEGIFYVGYDTEELEV